MRVRPLHPLNLTELSSLLWNNQVRGTLVPTHKQGQQLSPFDRPHARGSKGAYQFD